MYMNAYSIIIYKSKSGNQVSINWQMDNTAWYSHTMECLPIKNEIV